MSIRGDLKKYLGALGIQVLRLGGSSGPLKHDPPLYLGYRAKYGRSNSTNKRTEIRQKPGAITSRLSRSLKVIECDTLSIRIGLPNNDP